MSPSATQPAAGVRARDPFLVALGTRLVSIDQLDVQFATMTILASFGTGQVFLSMLYFFLFFIWIWLLISVFGDVFRSHDLSGRAKALWVIFVIVVPYFGVFIYLIVRGGKIAERTAADSAPRS